MIVGISGWQRTFKTGMGALLSAYPSEVVEYPILKGVGNLHVNTPYNWEYLRSAELKKRITESVHRFERNMLYFVDEADRVFPPRTWKDPDQIMALTGIWQDEKMQNLFIYTFHKGRPDDTLLGVDKLLRASTMIEIEIIAIDKVAWTIAYEVRDWLNGRSWQAVLSGIDKYFSLWNHEEPVI